MEPLGRHENGMKQRGGLKRRTGEMRDGGGTVNTREGEEDDGAGPRAA